MNRYRVCVREEYLVYFDVYAESEKDICSQDRSDWTNEDFNCVEAKIVNVDLLEEDNKNADTV